MTILLCGNLISSALEPNQIIIILIGSSAPSSFALRVGKACVLVTILKKEPLQLASSRPSISSLSIFRTPELFCSFIGAIFHIVFYSINESNTPNFYYARIYSHQIFCKYSVIVNNPTTLLSWGLFHTLFLNIISFFNYFFQGDQQTVWL